MSGLPNYPERVAVLRRRRDHLEQLVGNHQLLASLLRQKAELHDRLGRPTKVLVAEAASYASIGARLAADLAAIDAWLSDPATDESLPEIQF